MFRKTIFATALLSIAAASPVMANADPRLQFIAEIQANAAASGIDAERVVRSNDQLTIIGTDHQGKRATLFASCTRSQIQCPAARGTVVAVVAIG